MLTSFQLNDLIWSEELIDKDLWLEIMTRLTRYQSNKEMHDVEYIGNGTIHVYHNFSLLSLLIVIKITYIWVQLKTHGIPNKFLLLEKLIVMLLIKFFAKKKKKKIPTSITQEDIADDALAIARKNQTLNGYIFVSHHRMYSIFLVYGCIVLV